MVDSTISALSENLKKLGDLFYLNWPQLAVQLLGSKSLAVEYCRMWPISNGAGKTNNPRLKKKRDVSATYNFSVQTATKRNLKKTSSGHSPGPDTGKYQFGWKPETLTKIELNTW